MQQEKMGCLLKELRKERGMTQEQMAELFGVSNRTVSRWENGKNMPDISILIEISNYFNVGVLELIEGERTKEAMTTEKKDELKEIASYADGQKRIILKNIHRNDVIGIIACLMGAISLDALRIFGERIWLLLVTYSVAVMGGILLCNISYSCGFDKVLREYLKKHRIIALIEIWLVVMLVYSVCRDSYLFLIGRF